LFFRLTRAAKRSMTSAKESDLVQKVKSVIPKLTIGMHKVSKGHLHLVSKSHLHTGSRLVGKGQSHWKQMTKKAKNAISNPTSTMHKVTKSHLHLSRVTKGLNWILVLSYSTNRDNANGQYTVTVPLPCSWYLTTG
jgi:hypothetical protein